MKLLSYSIVTVFLAVAMIRSIGIYRLIPMPVTILVFTACALGGLLLIKRTQPTVGQLSFWVSIFLLLVYTTATSKHPNISLLLSFFMLASATVWLGLIGADKNFLKTQGGAEPTTAVTDAAKLGFFTCTTIHALSLVLFYLFVPERTTGLMDDFSQASMLLLCGYAMAYPMLAKKPYFSALSLLYFTAFFTTFSRTANVLMIIFLVAVFIMEYQKRNIRFAIKLIGLATLGLMFVYLYPIIIGESVVDRGGLAHLSTLNSRTIYWQTAWEAITIKPWLGHGLGTYTYTGIGEAQPFNKILYVHNDYLQIWHDFGLIWLLLFVATYAYLTFSNAPVSIKRDGYKFNLLITTVDNRRFLAWTLVVCIGLYMGINFLITNAEFQLALALFSIDLLRK